MYYYNHPYSRNYIILGDCYSNLKTMIHFIDFNMTYFNNLKGILYKSFIRRQLITYAFVKFLGTLDI